VLFVSSQSTKEGSRINTFMNIESVHVLNPYQTCHFVKQKRLESLLMGKLVLSSLSSYSNVRYFILHGHKVLRHFLIRFRTHPSFLRIFLLVLDVYLPDSHSLIHCFLCRTMKSAAFYSQISLPYR